ncbi:MAG: deoxyribose-phosphate aldolase, partial [Candidatus Methanomethylicia archaeon]
RIGLEELAQQIDNTILRPEVGEKGIIEFVEKSLNYNFACIVVPPCYIKMIRESFKDKIRLATVISFPLGYQKIEVKKYEVEKAIEDGVNEVDYVINISYVKSGKYDGIKLEANELSKIVKSSNVIIKAIIETPLLTTDEIALVSKTLNETDIDYIKTCTGFGPRGVIPSDIIIIRENSNKKVKASGGIRSLRDTIHYLMLGANRIGTSHGIEIMKELMKIKEI